MKVAVVGCGSMGTILGAFLAKGGADVVLVDNYKAHVDALNEKGATVVGTIDMNVPVKACTPEEMEGIYDLVFLFTKQTANDEILPMLLPHLAEDSTVCTLQNGVPEPYVAEYVGQKRTVGGTVLWSATFKEPGVSELTQKLETLDHFFGIGEMDGTIGPRIQMVADVLGLMGKAEIDDSLMAQRWQKLIYNACMSGMSAACATTFGGVLDNPKTWGCLSYLANEVVTCAKAEGYKLPTLLGGFNPEDLFLTDQASFVQSQKIFHDTYQIALPAKASMLQDLEKGRKTEVPMINGYVCQTGRKHGIPTPFNDTVVDIVSKVEKGELPLSNENKKYFDDAWFTFEPSKI